MQQGIGGLPGATTRPQFRIGLNSGLALVGNIGAAEMRNFSALGDTTNLAARLQTYAAEGTVVIGAGTYDLIREQALVRSLGSPQLKGKSQPVEAFELLGLVVELATHRPRGELMQPIEARRPAFAPVVAPTMAALCGGRRPSQRTD